MTTLYRYTGLMNTLRKPVRYFSLSVTDNSPVLQMFQISSVISFNENVIPFDTGIMVKKNVFPA